MVGVVGTGWGPVQDHPEGVQKGVQIHPNQVLTSTLTPVVTCDSTEITIFGSPKWTQNGTHLDALWGGWSGWDITRERISLYPPL